MYNDNKYFYYTRRCISYYTRQCIITNICCNYIKKYIITTNISIIHESVFLIIQDDVQ